MPLPASVGESYARSDGDARKGRGGIGGGRTRERTRGGGGGGDARDSRARCARGGWSVLFWWCVVVVTCCCCAGALEADAAKEAALAAARAKELASELRDQTQRADGLEEQAACWDAS